VTLKSNHNWLYWHILMRACNFFRNHAGACFLGHRVFRIIGVLLVARTYERGRYPPRTLPSLISSRCRLREDNRCWHSPTRRATWSSVLWQMLRPIWIVGRLACSGLVYFKTFITTADHTCIGIIHYSLQRLQFAATGITAGAGGEFSPIHYSCQTRWWCALRNFNAAKRSFCVDDSFV